MTAQPVTYDLPSRMLVSAAATALLVLSTAGAVAFGGWRIWNLATGASTLFAAFHTAVVDSIAFVGLVLALGLIIRMIRGPRPLGHRWWAPHFVERRVRRLIELSAFGVAPLVGWSAADPHQGIGHLVQPASEDRVRAWLDGLTEADPSPSTRGRDAIRSLTANGSSPSTGTAIADGAPSWDGPVQDHVVQRGDTYWSLAERILDDGERWAEIMGLNLGRTVSDGVVLDSDMSLRRGWTIVVPRVDAAFDATTEAGRPHVRRGLIR